jgi:DNA-binding response OmpR family regulator
MQNKKPHVIVCEDDPELNIFIRCAFKLDGFETHQALSSTECIEKINELKDEENLAVVVNGRVAADRSAQLILKVRMMMIKNLKILVIADRSMSEEKVRIMDYGADEFTVIPISVESIVNKINSILLAEAISSK